MCCGRPTYDAYGAAEVSVATLDMPLRYPGQFDDGEGYGVYNWHRSYIPELGIYTSLDPLFQHHGALYGYAGGESDVERGSVGALGAICPWCRSWWDSRRNSGLAWSIAGSRDGL